MCIIDSPYLTLKPEFEARQIEIFGEMAKKGYIYNCLLYTSEEVDRFLDKVEEQLKQDEDQAEELRRQIAELTAQNQRLHKEMESYEADGDMLKSALINAQRMGENVIREANQKSEEILHRANLRGCLLYTSRCV